MRCLVYLVCFALLLFACFLTLTALLYVLCFALRVEHQKLNQKTPYGAVWLSLLALVWLD